MNRSQEINREARKRFVEKCERNWIMSCEVGLPGCMGDYSNTWHHRRKRRWYYDRNPEKQIEKLSALDTAIRICWNCHDKLEKDSRLSEKYFKIILKRRKEQGVF